MYLNPIGVSNHNDFFAKAIEKIKENDTEVHIASLNSSVGIFDNLEIRTYQALATADILKAVRQAANEKFDALVIGCFYDTALYDAREVSGDMVVVAPCHSSIEIALTLSNHFSIIVGKQKWVSQMQKLVCEYGYSNKLSSFQTIGMGVLQLQQDRTITYKKMVEAGKRAIEIDKAESLILGCTFETGFYSEMMKELEVPVIDPVVAAFKNAEYMANLKLKFGLIPSRKWGSDSPLESDLKKYNIFQSEYVFGDRIIIK